MSQTACADDLPWEPTRRPKPVRTNPLYGIKPRTYQVAGKPVSFYLIGALAQVLGRKADTIRMWEEEGWLPAPRAVFPGRDPRNADSARHGRRRLYTAAQILGILQIAREEGILEKHARPIKDTAFRERAHQLFKDLADEERTDREREAGQ